MKLNALAASAHAAPLAAALTAAGMVAMGAVEAQIPQGAPPPPQEPRTARESQPIDYTGYWVAVVTEDWQWRFVTPIVGDYTAVPLNSRGIEVAEEWDHEADLAAGEHCKAFGAAHIMRLPTRLRILWQDDDTLQLDWDLGTQSRAVHFNGSGQPGERSWQGHAEGEWISTQATGGRFGGGGAANDNGPRPGGMKTVTTHLRPQYLRMNGVPVSENAVVTEYLDIVPAPDGQEWLIVKTIVEDPAYLSQPYIVSSHFRREADGSRWSPSECELLPRLRGTATTSR